LMTIPIGYSLLCSELQSNAASGVVIVKTGGGVCLGG
jgi:hypothetical protein